jgi:hypothetical protein
LPNSILQRISLNLAKPSLRRFQQRTAAIAPANDADWQNSARGYPLAKNPASNAEPTVREAMHASFNAAENNFKFTSITLLFGLQH